MNRRMELLSVVVLLLFGLSLHFVDPSRDSRSFASPEPPTPLPSDKPEPGADLEAKLKSLAKPFAMTDWQRKYKEPGQTFAEYLAAMPVRRSASLTTIYLCLLGDFTPEQEKVIEVTRQYMGLFFDCPVKIHNRVPLSTIPAEARRVHPTWGDKQIHANHVLEKVLIPDRPDDALAYLAFTASDLWPGENWNFVFGQANLYKRVGVWSIYRNGDPRTEYTACLRRTMSTATHETGHILTIQHCIALDCNMNGANDRDEGDRKPLHFCPVCARKLVWNLRVDPAQYFRKLEEFCRKHKLLEEAEYYGKAARLLAAGS